MFIKNKFGVNKKNDLHLCHSKRKNKMKHSLIYRQNIHQPAFLPLSGCIGLC